MDRVTYVRCSFHHASSVNIPDVSLSHIIYSDSPNYKPSTVPIDAIDVHLSVYSVTYTRSCPCFANHWCEQIKKPVMFELDHT